MECRPNVRGMLQNTQTIDEREYAPLKRQFIDISLQNMQIRESSKICVTGIDSVRIINRNDVCTRLQRHLGKSPGATTHVEYPLAPKLLRCPRRSLPEPIGRYGVPRCAIQLRRSKHVPLHPEVVRIVLLRYETRDEIDHGITPGAAGISKRSAFYLTVNG